MSLLEEFPKIGFLHEIFIEQDDDEFNLRRGHVSKNLILIYRTQKAQVVVLLFPLNALVDNFQGTKDEGLKICFLLFIFINATQE